MRRVLTSPVLLLPLLACALAPLAPALQDEVGRRALEHEDYSRWSSVRTSGRSSRR